MNVRGNLPPKAAPLLTALTAGLALVVIAPCTAQTAWKPDKVIEFVVGSSPGGGNDATARLMQKIWRDNKWQDNVNVVNKPGAGGALAYTYVSQHAGDGHFIAVVRKALLTNEILGRSPLNYREMTPLAVVANEPTALAVRANSPVKGIKDLVVRFKANPQSITTSVGSTFGATSHLLLSQVAKIAGADPRRIKVVTFRGSNDSVINLLGGHIDLMGSSVDAMVPHHKEGTMRIIGISSAQRATSLPDVPTLKDQGYDVVMGNWTAIMGPKGLTPAQVAYWENLLERTFNHPDWKSMLEAGALEADFRKSQATREMLKKDFETERALLTELGMVK